jgi:hypothetical protein
MGDAKQGNDEAIDGDGTRYGAESRVPQ